VVALSLKHSRIYGFQRGAERSYWIGSADLMPRNLDTRVELIAPVTAEPLKQEIEDTLERCLADDTFGWELRPEGNWVRRSGGTRSVQLELMDRALEPASAE
jgi:polyphosphate kinase